MRERKEMECQIDPDDYDNSLVYRLVFFFLKQVAMMNFLCVIFLIFPTIGFPEEKHARYLHKHFQLHFNTSRTGIRNSPCSDLFQNIIICASL